MMDHRKILRSFLAAAAAVTLACPLPSGLAELAGTVETADTAGGTYALPMDSYEATGYTPNAACFTEDGYRDDSIEVTMSRIWLDDSCFCLAHVKIRDASQLRTGLAGKFLKKTNYVTRIAAQCKAVVATGGEFLSKNQSSYAVRMGVTLRKKGYKSRDTLVTDEHGDFHIFKGFSASNLTALTDEGHTVINCFNFGPALVIDGELQKIDHEYTVANVRYRAPRAAIGQLGPLEYLIVVVDGRNALSETASGSHKKSKGVTMEVLAQFMYDQQCIQAYNLDGGGSAVMYFNGDAYSTPSSTRSVDDILYFATAVPGEE